MWYSGYDGSTGTNIGYATSPDGINWTKYDDPITTVPPYDESDPVLDIGLPASWDDTYVGLCGVIFDNTESRYKMWYSGGTGPVIGDIGYAFTPPVSVEDNNPVEPPQNFSLLQNYPNPFNPATTITYRVPEEANVTLNVFNTVGEQVAKLVNEEKPAGSYEVVFSAIGGSAFGGDAYNLPSGVYFYKPQAGSFVETKKMILMK
jgi:hypothetical protein